MTGGDEPKEKPIGYSIPRRELLIQLYFAWIQGAVTLADDLERTEELTEELVGLRKLTTRKGKEKIETDIHDDLAVSVGLACFIAMETYRKNYTRVPMSTFYPNLANGMIPRTGSSISDRAVARFEEMFKSWDGDNLGSSSPDPFG